MASRARGLTCGVLRTTCTSRTAFMAAEVRRGLVSASVPMQAGQRHRLMQGRGRSGNEDGDFHDAPDWEYADGTPAPESRSRMIWQAKRQETAERIQRLREEVIELELQELERRTFGDDLVPPVRKVANE